MPRYIRTLSLNILTLQYALCTGSADSVSVSSYVSVTKCRGIPFTPFWEENSVLRQLIRRTTCAQGRRNHNPRVTFYTYTLLNCTWIIRRFILVICLKLRGISTQAPLYKIPCRWKNHLLDAQSWELGVVGWKALLSHGNSPYPHKWLMDTDSLSCTLLLASSPGSPNLSNPNPSRFSAWNIESWEWPGDEATLLSK